MYRLKLCATDILLHVHLLVFRGKQFCKPGHDIHSDFIESNPARVGDVLLQRASTGMLFAFPKINALHAHKTWSREKGKKGRTRNVQEQHDFWRSCDLCAFVKPVDALCNAAQNHARLTRRPIKLLYLHKKNAPVNVSAPYLRCNQRGFSEVYGVDVMRQENKKKSPGKCDARVEILLPLSTSIFSRLWILKDTSQQV